MGRKTNLNSAERIYSVSAYDQKEPSMSILKPIIIKARLPLSLSIPKGLWSLLKFPFISVFAVLRIKPKVLQVQERLTPRILLA